MMEPVRPVGRAYPSSSGGGGREPTNLGDILERVLDRGVIIAGDIRVNLLDIELLTIKLRLIVASVDTAREMGIDWWEHDPWLTGGKDRGLEEENRRLRRRLSELEGDRRSDRPIEGRVVEREPAREYEDYEEDYEDAPGYEDEEPEPEPVRRRPERGRRAEGRRRHDG
ncbi:gas vesicle protein GvpJ [Nonomuraea pusilla]|uniref:Gas vesicle protein n=1 Tax=Nonomuraea pusilla TaxID=46177 RepID=A0A1H8B5C6_9ACTN|nr:Gas vesicle protein [Nonomuraea pusilla]